MRSAITVAGMVGQSRSSSRIAGSKASTAEPGALAHSSGVVRTRSAARTVLRATPIRRAIALMPIPSARCSRRISAQSSTLINSFLPRPAMPPGSEIHTSVVDPRRGVRFRPAIRGQYSAVADTGTVFRSRRKFIPSVPIFNGPKSITFGIFVRSGRVQRPPRRHSRRGRGHPARSYWRATTDGRKTPTYSPPSGSRPVAVPASRRWDGLKNLAPGAGAYK